MAEMRDNYDRLINQSGISLRGGRPDRFESLDPTPTADSQDVIHGFKEIRWGAEGLVDAGTTLTRCQAADLRNVMSGGTRPVDRGSTVGYGGVSEEGWW